MSDPRAGSPAQTDDLVDVARLITAYYTEHPDPDDPGQQRIAFSAHEGFVPPVVVDTELAAATEFAGTSGGDSAAAADL